VIIRDKPLQDGVPSRGKGVTNMSPVGIIGGMGPFAGAQYLSIFLDECSLLIERGGSKVSDQCFPPHYVFQQPIPDRTSAILGSADDYIEILRLLSWQVDELRRLGAKAIAIACNTAHAWYAELQKLNGDIELIHIGDVAARHLLDSGETDVCLMSTAGTIKSQLYAQSLSKLGISCYEPNAQELETIMTGIYGGVKSGNYTRGRECFSNAVARMRGRTGVSSFLMACTEIPLALTAADVPLTCRLYDPARLSARELAMRALNQPRSLPVGL
jgi:aspartate racemase